MIRSFIKFLLFILLEFALLMGLSIYMITPSYAMVSNDVSSSISSDHLPILNDPKIDDTLKDYVICSEDMNIVVHRPRTTIRYIKNDIAFATAVDGEPSTEEFFYGDEVYVILPLPKEGEQTAQILFEDKVYNISRESLTNIKPEVRYIGSFNLTAYAWTGNRCANGRFPRKDYTVAANKNDFPLGTRLYIDGYGIFVVEDRGSFPKGTIDIYIGDKNKCIEFGRRKAKVYVLMMGDGKRYKAEKYNPSIHDKHKK